MLKKTPKTLNTLIFYKPHGFLVQYHTFVTWRVNNIRCIKSLIGCHIVFITLPIFLTVLVGSNHIKTSSVSKTGY